SGRRGVERGKDQRGARLHQVQRPVSLTPLSALQASERAATLTKEIMESQAETHGFGSEGCSTPWGEMPRVGRSGAKCCAVCQSTRPGTRRTEVLGSRARQ